MKIEKKNIYGVFYKDNGMWRGPVKTLTLQNKKDRKTVKKAARKTLKKKVRLLKQIWSYK